MTDLLHKLDLDLLLAINGAHSDLLDKIMWAVSGRFTWIPLYLLFILLLIRDYRWQIWKIIIALALMVLISDQVCNLAKFSMMRIRPSNDPAIRPLLHLVNDYSGGLYGFYSAHASNSFAVALFMILMVRRHVFAVAATALTWALLISYSRVYLGVHYPTDVITGIISGLAISSVITAVTRMIIRRSLQKKKQ